MSKIRAAVMPGGGAPVEIEEFVPPQLEAGSALLEVDLSEVCGTDVHLRDGRLDGVPYPIIPGHVSAGRLAQVRGPLSDIEGQPLREGDRVTFLDVHRTCHACWHCLVAKASTRCPRRKVYGITYGVEDGLAGGWSQQIYLKPGTNCIRLEGVDARAFMAGGCSLPTALHALDRAEVRIGDTVLVLGSGPVGLSSIILARMAGALRVLCIGAPDHRLETARQVGAQEVLNFQSHSPQERVQWVMERCGGRGADITIEATGAPSAVVDAMRFTRDAGRVVVVGQYTDHGEIAFNPHLDLNKKHLDVRGCWGSDFSHFHRGVKVLTDPERAEPWLKIPLRSFALEQTNQALSAVESGEVVKALIEPGAAGHEF
ncbi:MAG TPA: zinc-binding dehydrogenase [Acidobacteriota bacterium]|nr:zinc-binding dehydrogenase [Acidobacteriota bacterium]